VILLRILSTIIGLPFLWFGLPRAFSHEPAERFEGLVISWIGMPPLIWGLLARGGILRRGERPSTPEERDEFRRRARDARRIAWRRYRLSVAIFAALALVSFAFAVLTDLTHLLGTASGPVATVVGGAGVVLALVAAGLVISSLVTEMNLLLRGSR
jgi:hypothetical protein